MNTLHRLVGITLLLISHARFSVAMPLINSATAAPAASATAPYSMTLSTGSPAAVTVASRPAPDFDKEVLVPLRAAQAKADAQAARLAAQRAKLAAAKVAAKAAPAKQADVSDAMLLKLRLCEAGGIYNRNTGNGYYGAYQYSISTWNNYAGYARADLAPAHVQDEKVRIDVARRGFSPWPSCARRIGAM